MSAQHVYALGRFIVRLWGLSLCLFLIPHLLPGAPVTFYENWPSTPPQRARLISEYSLDRGLPLQYVRWLQRLVTGQWGTSRYSNRPVLHDVWLALRLTCTLLLWTLVTWGIAGLVLWGSRRCVPWSPATPRHAFYVLVLHVLPNFLVAMILRDVIVWQMGWVSMANLPLFDPSYLWQPLYMLLPAATLALTPLCAWLASELSPRPQDMSLIQRCRQRLSQVRRLLQPAMGLFLLQVCLVEYIFAFPGLGNLGIEAMKRRDIPMIQATLFSLCLGFMLLVRLHGSARPCAVLSAFSPDVVENRVCTNTPLWRRLAPAVGYAVALGGLALLGPYLVLYSPMEIHSHDQFLGPSYRYFLGTDFLGRDVLSRTLTGFRSTLPRLGLLMLVSCGLGWGLVLCLRILPQWLRPVWRLGLAVCTTMPVFVRAFVIFLVCERQSWAVDLALLLACLPTVSALLATQAAVSTKLAHVVHLGGLLLLLDVTFAFLNLNAESFIPTWGSDIRHGLHYGHINMWMILAPALAVTWCRYGLYHMGRNLGSVAT